MTQVEIAASAYRALLAHAEREAPDECCGLLIGHGGRIEDARPARNAASDRRRRFLIDPADHFACIRAARGAGLAVVGAYHSHPQGAPAPSATDAAEAFEDEQFIHLIAVPGVEGGPARVAAYVWRQGVFDALPVIVK